MRYLSTRGRAPELGFADVLLGGLAPDGGLYVPEEWPKLAPSTGSTYVDRAVEVMSPFVEPDIDEVTLTHLCAEAYATFRHGAVVPLVQVGDRQWVQELFHGPTLAFKDVAMQILARLMDHVLKTRGERVTIIGATSGDTGGAAIDAFQGNDRADIFILYPDGRVSDVQRRQMTTVAAPNVHALAIDGTFDDCQAHVKAMFQNGPFRDRVRMSGVNSINWARIMAQVVYYFTSAVALGGPNRPVSFTVPTGNFGDILAGYVAKKMGLPIDRLVIATNRNDILRRALETGRYETDAVHHTQSPSMDIQVSSNFERLLFEAGNRSAEDVRASMAALKQSGAFTIDPATLAAIRADFDAATLDEAETGATITDVQERAGYLLDPHTAVGWGAARDLARAGRVDPAVPMVVLGTAHPAKFPAAVERASGIHPALPDHLSDLHSRPERATRLANETAAIEAHITDHARAAAHAPA